MNTLLLVVYNEENGLVHFTGNDIPDLNEKLRRAFDNEEITASDFSEDGMQKSQLFILTPQGVIEEKYLEPHLYVQFQPT